MVPRNGNPKTALEVLGTIAAGSSLGGLCLLAEERRRRLTLAQKIVENGRRLQSHKSYQSVAPLEAFDDARSWETPLPHPLRSHGEYVEHHEERLGLPEPPERARLTNVEWRSRRRKHRPIPTASPTTLHTASSIGDDLNHWEMTAWPSQREDLSSTSDMPTKPSLSVEEKTMETTEDQNDSSASHTPFLHSSFGSWTQPRSQVKGDVHSAASSMATTFNPELSYKDMAPDIHKTSIKYAKNLERTVAQRALACFKTDEEDVIWSGIKEIQSFFHGDRQASPLFFDMRKAISIAQEKLRNKSSPIEQDLRALQERGESAMGSTDSRVSGLHATIQDALQLQSSGQSKVADRIMQLSTRDKLHEAHFIFQAFCQQITEPLIDPMRQALSTLMDAFNEVGLGSVAIAIRQKCLVVFKEWHLFERKAKKDLQHAQTSQVADLITDIFRNVFQLDMLQCLTYLKLVDLDLRTVLDSFQQCIWGLEHQGAWQDALKLQIVVSKHFAVQHRAPYLANAQRLVQKAIEAGSLREAEELALLNSDATKIRPFEANTFRDALRSVCESKDWHRGYRLALAGYLRSGPLYEELDPSEYLVIFRHLPSSRLSKFWDRFKSRQEEKHMRIIHASFDWCLEQSLFDDCAQIIKAVEAGRRIRQLDRATAKRFIDVAYIHLHSHERLIASGSDRSNPKTSGQEQLASLEKLVQSLMKISAEHRFPSAHSRFSRLISRQREMDRPINTFIRDQYRKKDLGAIARLRLSKEVSHSLDEDSEIMRLHAIYAIEDHLNADDMAMELVQRGLHFERLPDGALCFLLTATDIDTTAKAMETMEKRDSAMKDLPTPALRFLINSLDESKAMCALEVLFERFVDGTEHDRILDLWNSNASLFKKLSAAGAPRRVMFVLEAFASRGSFVTADTFFDSLPMDSLHHSSSRVQTAYRQLLLRCWKSTGNLELTLNVFSSLKQRIGLSSVHVELFNVVILASVEYGDLSATKDLICQLTNAGLEPTFETWSYQLLADGRDGNWQVIEQSIRRLTSQGTFATSNSGLLDRVIVEHCRQHSAKDSVAFVRGIEGLETTFIIAQRIAEAIVKEQDSEALGEWLKYLKPWMAKQVISHESVSFAIQRMLQSTKLKYDEHVLSLTANELASFKTANDLTDLINASNAQRVLSAEQTKSSLATNAQPAQALPTNLITHGEDLDSSLAPHIAPINRPLATQSSRDRTLGNKKSMLGALSKDYPEEALASYKSSLHNGLPFSIVELELAVTAASRLAVPEDEWLGLANQLISDAKKAGLDTTSAQGILLRHRIAKSSSPITEAWAIDTYNDYCSTLTRRRDLTNPFLPIVLAQKLLSQRQGYAGLRILKLAEERLHAAGASFGLPAYSCLLNIFIWLEDAERIKWTVQQILDRNLPIDKRIVRRVATHRQRLENDLRNIIRKGGEGSERAMFLEQQLIPLLREAKEIVEERKEAQRTRSTEFVRDMASLMADQGRRTQVREGLKSWARERDEADKGGEPRAVETDDDVD